MRFFLILAVGIGGGYWWFTHRPTPATSSDSVVATAAPTSAQAPAAPPVAPSPTAASSSTAAPAAREASWPRRNIDRAQAAVGAAKAQHEGF